MLTLEGLVSRILYGRHGPNGYSSGWLEKLHVSINKFINTTYLPHPSAHLADSFYARPWGMKKKLLHVGYQLLWLHYSHTHNDSPRIRIRIDSLTMPNDHPSKSHFFCFKAGFRVCRVGAPCHLYQSCIWNLLSLCSHGALHPRSRSQPFVALRKLTQRSDPAFTFRRCPNTLAPQFVGKKHTKHKGSGGCQGEVRMNIYKRYL